MSEVTPVEARLGKNARTFGFVAIGLGILAILAPLAVGVSIVLLVGLLMIAGGLLRFSWAFRSKSLGQDLFGLAIAGLTLLCGVILVTDPIVGSGILTVLLTIYLLADGAIEVATAWRLRPASGWGWLMTGGVLSVLLGLLIWQQFPLSGAWAIGVLLGIKLLLVGMIMISLAPASRPGA
jgi:uncharacterized membrane protein HdeD (DUF308 family)